MFFRYILLFLLLYTSTFSLAQKIEVTVVDDEYSAISGATVQLLKNEKTITYATTNSEGKAMLNAQNIGDYTLSTSFWGYENKVVGIKIINAYNPIKNTTIRK